MEREEDDVLTAGFIQFVLYEEQHMVEVCIFMSTLWKNFREAVRLAQATFWFRF